VRGIEQQSPALAQQARYRGIRSKVAHGENAVHHDERQLPEVLISLPD
jgi:hypothetical protein